MTDYPQMQQTEVDVRLTRSNDGEFLLTVQDRKSRGKLVEIPMDAEHFADLLSNRGIFDVPARVATAEVSAMAGRKRLTTTVRLASDFHPLHDGEYAMRELSTWMLALGVNHPEVFGLGATISVSSVKGGYDVIVRHYSTEDIAGFSQQEWLERAIPDEWRRRS